MYIELTITTFMNLFRDNKTLSGFRNFSYDGLTALYDYYDDIDGGEYKVDVIAICCAWMEYDTVNEAFASYDMQTLDKLRDCTSIIELDNGGLLVHEF